MEDPNDETDRNSTGLGSSNYNVLQVLQKNDKARHDNVRHDLSTQSSAKDCEIGKDSSNICSECGKDFYSKASISICCDSCDNWYHISCCGISIEQHEHFSLPSENWDCPKCTSLPSFRPAVDLIGAKWGNLEDQDIAITLEVTHRKIASWKPNHFKIPSGASGKAFVSEITRLVDLWVNKTKLESVAITALQVFGLLMLQKPSKSSKNRDHIKHLTSRLVKWQLGKFDELVSECEAIQKRLINSNRKPESIIKVFSRLMLHGKVSAAMRWLGENKSLPLQIDPAVRGALESKHPGAEPVSYNHLM